MNFHWEKHPNGKKQRRVTDPPINEERQRAGRAEGTKLTLKNQGCCFEHNHGEKNLSTVFALMLAFLLNGDVASWQAQMKARRSSCFREKVRGLFLNCFLKDRETLCVRASSGNSREPSS